MLTTDIVHHRRHSLCAPSVSRPIPDLLSHLNDFITRNTPDHHAFAVRSLPTFVLIPTLIS
ncbi:hypothetical protein B0H34DRAFT_56529 [Crassisporium funariophilum]|nr:hypothetical protein B0H34DRAFT_56529 [Crassisporium funariophilum]